MRIALIVSFILSFSIAKAQVSTDMDSTVYTAAEHEPRFPGGIQKFAAYFSKNIRVASIAPGKEIRSKLLIEWIVETDGSLSHVKVLKSISPEVDKQAVDALLKSPKWTPGLMNNKPVRVKYQFPMTIDWAQE